MRNSRDSVSIISISALLLLAAQVSPALSSTGQEVQRRLDEDLAAGKPIVVHVVVALCDNQNQRIIPVSEELGNGQVPRSNLFWGALYGVRTYLSQRAGWELVTEERPEDGLILERIVLLRRIERDGTERPVYLLAEAWDGSQIRAATGRFLALASGHASETLPPAGNLT